MGKLLEQVCWCRPRLVVEEKSPPWNYSLFSSRIQLYELASSGGCVNKSEGAKLQSFHAAESLELRCSGTSSYWWHWHPIWECWVESQMLCFWTSSLLMFLEGGLGPWPLPTYVGEQDRIPTANSGLVQTWQWWPFEKWTRRWKSCLLSSLLFCLQANKYISWNFENWDKICHVKVGVPVLVGPVNCFFGMGSASQCTEQLNLKDLFQLWNSLVFYLAVNARKQFRVMK